MASSCEHQEIQCKQINQWWGIFTGCCTEIRFFWFFFFPRPRVQRRHQSTCSSMYRCVRHWYAVAQLCEWNIPSGTAWPMVSVLIFPGEFYVVCRCPCCSCCCQLMAAFSWFTLLVRVKMNTLLPGCAQAEFSFLPWACAVTNWAPPSISSTMVR